MTALSDLMTSWGSVYANHATLRTLVAFVHVAALIIGGGLALATDRATLIAYKQDDVTRRSQLEGLVGTHRVVLISLALIAVSGILLFAADFDTYLHSRFFWAQDGTRRVAHPERRPALVSRDSGEPWRPRGLGCAASHRARQHRPLAPDHPWRRRLAEYRMMKKPTRCSSRREFLQLSCFTLTAAALGLNSADASPLPVSFADGGQSGSERRYADSGERWRHHRSQRASHPGSLSGLGLRVQLVVPS